MKLIKRSMITGRVHEMELNCTEQQYIEAREKWHNGVLIQNAFTFLNEEEREFVKTGITPEEWNELIVVEGESVE